MKSQTRAKVYKSGIYVARLIFGAIGSGAKWPIIKWINLVLISIVGSDHVT